MKRIWATTLLLCVGLLLSGTGCGSTLNRIDIPIRIEEPTGLARTNWPVGIGLPFRPGQLQNVHELVALDPAEAPLPTQSRVTTRHEDGSIAWAYVQFPATMRAQTTETWRLVSRARAGLDTPIDTILSVNETDAHIELATERLKLRISKGPFALFEQVSVDDQVVAGGEKGDGLTIVDDKGVEFRSALGRKPGVTVEERGPVRAVVRIQGDHRNNTGKRLFDYIVKVYAFADQNFVRVDYTFINTSPEDVTKIKEIVLKASMVKGDGFRALTADYKEDKFYEFTEPFYLLQKKPDYSYGVFAGADIFKDDGTKILGLGYETEARGRWWINAFNGRAGVTAALDRMVENYPKKLRACPDGIEVHLWPREGGMLEFHQGMAKTHTVYFHYHTGDPKKTGERELAIQLHEAAIPWTPLYTDLRHSLLGPVLPYMPKRIPNIERGLRKAYVAWEGGGMGRGMIDYGDTLYSGGGPRGRFMSNCSYDFPLTSLQQWARTGERRYFRGGVAAAEHLIDIDAVHFTTHEPAELGGIRIHGEGHRQYNAEGFKDCSVVPSHTWIEGLVLYSQITGDMRGIETAKGVGQSMLKMLEKGWLTPPYVLGWHGARDSAWPIVALCTLYKVTHEEKYLAAAKQIVEGLKRYQRPDGRFPMWIGYYEAAAPLQSSIALIALMRYHQTTGDPEVKDMFLRGLDHILKGLRRPDGDFMYISAPDYRSGCSFPIEAFPYGYVLTKDRRYLREIRPIAKRILTGYHRGQITTRGEGALCYDWRGIFPHLYWCHRAGVLQDVPE